MRETSRGARPRVAVVGCPCGSLRLGAKLALPVAIALAGTSPAVSLGASVTGPFPHGPAVSPATASAQARSPAETDLREALGRPFVLPRSGLKRSNKTKTKGAPRDTPKGQPLDARNGALVLTVRNVERLPKESVTPLRTSRENRGKGKGSRIRGARPWEDPKVHVE